MEDHAMPRDIGLLRVAAMLFAAVCCLGAPVKGWGAGDALNDELRNVVIERVAGLYHRDDPRLALLSGSRLAQVLSDKQVAAADVLLAERAVPPLKQILAAGRLMIFQFGSEQAILPPQGKELLLTLEGLGDLISATQAEAQSHPLMSDYAPRPQKLDEFERVFWQFHVLHNRLLVARQTGEFGVLLVQSGADTRNQARSIAAFADLMEKTSQLDRQLNERRLAARIQRLRVACELLETTTSLEERFLAAYAVDFDGEILQTQFLAIRDQGRRFKEPALNMRELPGRVTQDLEHGRKLAGDLLDKSRLLFEGVHWWFRGRYGRGTNDDGLMKSWEAIESPEARMALFMPMKVPQPTDPLQEHAPVPAVNRRHYSLWLTTQRPRIQVTVLANPDFL